MVDTRCDNAGNYKNADLIQGLAAVSRTTGVHIQSLNTSEPGYGKDFCDRKIAVLRSLITEYKMTRKDVTNKEEMKMALAHNGGWLLVHSSACSLITCC